MNNVHINFCPQCGKSVSVADEHMNMKVACPHCNFVIDPWRWNKTPPASPGGGHRQRYNNDNVLYSSRNKVVAGLLGLVFGSIGLHRFYLGHITIGVIQIVLTIITGGIAGIWGFVEGILCLTGKIKDVDGLPLRD